MSGNQCSMGHTVPSKGPSHAGATGRLGDVSSLLLKSSAILTALTLTPTHISPSDKPSLGPPTPIHPHKAELKE